MLGRPYTPLWCKSHYSFLEGASHPEELVEEARRLGLTTLALTDRDGVYGVVRAHQKAKEVGLKLILGAEMTLADDSTLLLLSASREGYGNLCQLISTGRLRSPKGVSCVELEEVCAAAAGLVAIEAGPRSRLGQEREPGRSVEMLREAFGDRLYAMVARHQEAEDARREQRVRERAAKYGLPTVAGIEVLYHDPSRRQLQDVVTCIRHGVTLSTAGRLIRGNSEHAILSPTGFEKRFADDLDSVWRTEEIADLCTFSLDEIRYRYPSETLPDGTTSAQWLARLTDEGAASRYPEGVPEPVRAQIEKELGLIRELEYDGYFLTMWEIVRFCREKGILCQGRGSAANSAVCYCLGITAVDPVRMKLLFERFISRERAEPPDIDLDIEHDRREEVIQHVYEKYGRTHAAMVANFVRYRSRSAIREVGKVLGLPETGVDRLARRFSHFESLTPERLKETGFEPESRAHANLLRLTMEIQDFPRHLSIHPGGFLLGYERVDRIVPIENATMPGRTVIQWDKEDLEELGLFKVDLLGLGALNVVHRAFDLIEQHRGRRWSMAEIPPQDELTFEMIREGDTIGVFQIESRAQMAMLPRLRPRNYYDLVIEVSIVRPGPITGGMVHPYLRRRNGEEAVTYPHESLEPILEKTLGIPLFQEQVMQLAVVAADYTPGEADQLRRDMAAWRKSGRIERHRERLISRMVRKGIAREFGERVFEQIRGFGEYGFPESHAASFALIAYATAWLRCHHPAVFLCALLNAQPMGFYSPATLIDDAKRHGVEVRPVDVIHSEWDCTLEEERESGEGFAVRIGLRFVKGLSRQAGDRLLEVRALAPFESWADFERRTQLDRGATERLVEAGAAQSFDPDRRQVLWDVGRTFDEESLPLQVAEPEAAFEPLSAFETIAWDYRRTGHSPRGHPLEPLRPELRRQRLPTAADIRGLEAKSNGRPIRIRYAGLVICRQRPGTAGGVVFMTLEDETGFVNLILWERVYEQYRNVARATSLLGVTGKLQFESGVIHLIAEELWVPSLSEKPARGSRDFH